MVRLNAHNSEIIKNVISLISLSCISLLQYHMVICFIPPKHIYYYFKPNYHDYSQCNHSLIVSFNILPALPVFPLQHLKGLSEHEANQLLTRGKQSLILGRNEHIHNL